MRIVVGLLLIGGAFSAAIAQDRPWNRHNDIAPIETRCKLFETVGRGYKRASKLELTDLKMITLLPSTTDASIIEIAEYSDSSVSIFYGDTYPEHDKFIIIEKTNLSTLETIANRNK